MKFVNLTPYVIKLNDGREFPSEGVALVVTAFYEFEDDICSQEFGEVEGLPNPEKGTLFIVSELVLSAAKAAGRTDCVAPATGHPHTIRNNKGHVVSVPGFVK